MKSNLITDIDIAEKSILLFSEDESSCVCVLSLINSILKNYSFFFKAEGLLDNLKEIKNFLSEETLINENDGRKFYVKKLPELYSLITEKGSIEYLINNWVSTIYEIRIIFVVDMNENLTNTNIEYERIIRNINNNYICKIENVPESNFQNTFKIVCTDTSFNNIISFIKKQQFML